MPHPVCERIYRDDPYLTRFRARVIRAAPAPGGRLAMELDRTLFYPTGGGQPHDTGLLAGLHVVDVQEAGEGRIVHIVRLETGGAPGPGDEVDGAIEWPRRFDHMQQHSGQHILSRAFLKTADAATRSFHLGEGTCTIDLDLEAPTDAAMRRAEEMANEAIFADHAVRVLLRSQEESASYDLVLMPGELVRVIAVGDFDETPCGGTHVTTSGRVGCVTIRSWERFKGGARVTFLCGGRAVTEAARLASLVDRSAARLSSPASDIPDAIARMQDQAAASRRDLKAMAERLADLECEALDARARSAGALRVIVACLAGRDADSLQRLARACASGPGRAALLAGTDHVSGRASLVFVRSEGSAGGLRLADLMAAVCAARGGKGGGGADFARGGGIPNAEAAAALEEAFEWLSAAGAA